MHYLDDDPQDHSHGSIYLTQLDAQRYLTVLIFFNGEENRGRVITYEQLNQLNIAYELFLKSLKEDDVNSHKKYQKLFHANLDYLERILTLYKEGLRWK